MRDAECTRQARRLSKATVRHMDKGQDLYLTMLYWIFNDVKKIEESKRKTWLFREVATSLVKN
jgi:hypothetical protein